LISRRKSFFGVALRLHELEKTEGRPFEDLTEEYGRRRESVGMLAKEIKLSADVEGKEQSLIRHNDIGLTDEDLLRLRAFLRK
jgi:hypothetical protein